MNDAPRVWVLLGGKGGDNNQLRYVAQALGWPYEEKQIVHNRWSEIPNVILGASLFSVDRRRSAPLEPPWPDLVFAASRRAAPVARWVKRQSGGRTRLVHFLHAQAPLDDFDLIVTQPQYVLPRLDKVFECALTLVAASPPAGNDTDLAELRKLGRPLYALMVGGNSSTYRLDVSVAVRLVREVSQRVNEEKGFLLATTSPRTRRTVAAELRRELDCPHVFYEWKRNDPENPYRRYLAAADRLIVTIDSASQIADAVATGKPVEVFAWEPRTDKPRGLRRLVHRIALRRAKFVDTLDRPPLPERIYEHLMRLGLVKPPRDFERLVRGLRARGLAGFWGEKPEPGQRRMPDDLERVVERIRRLMDSESGTT